MTPSKSASACTDNHSSSLQGTLVGAQVSVAILGQASLASPLAGAYHSGFNAGYNCAESTNFATPTWIEIGAIAKTCDCRDDCVRIDLRLFLDVSFCGQ